MREDELLERVDLVLEVHEVRDRLVPVGRRFDCVLLIEGAFRHSPFVRVVDTLERDVLFVLKQTVELGAQAMEAQL